MGGEIENGLVLGPEVTRVEQLIKGEILHLGSSTPSPQQTPLEVCVTLGPNSLLWVSADGVAGHAVCT
jgi:hypothetical protein